jgi:hypothetical protein
MLPKLPKMLKFAISPTLGAKSPRETFFCAQLRKLEKGFIRVRGVCSNAVSCWLSPSLPRKAPFQLAMRGSPTNPSISSAKLLQMGKPSPAPYSRFVAELSNCAKGAKSSLTTLGRTEAPKWESSETTHAHTGYLTRIHNTISSEIEGVSKTLVTKNQIGRYLGLIDQGFNTPRFFR